MNTRTGMFRLFVGMVLLALLMTPGVGLAMSMSSETPDIEEETQSVHIVRGKIVDSTTGTPLAFATINIEGTAIGTVSNSEGEFQLKIPKIHESQSVKVAFIGYRDKIIAISALKSDKNRIELEAVSITLSQISIFPADPQLLIRAVIKRKKENYGETPELMTAFYRETIKKRKSYASLSEAVVEVYKQSYHNERDDLVRLLKGRKSDDYTRLDTLVFKLQGGPISTLSLDVVKNPYLILEEEVMHKYNYRISNITKSNDRLIYVLDFEQKKEFSEPLFYGKLFIDTESLAITGASYSINTSNKAEVGKLFIRKKPAGADVYPTEANYLVNYAQHNGKWAFSYSRGDVTFKVNWKKKWFNTFYHTTIEMAATNWNKEDATRPFKPSDRLKMSVVMNDAVGGFADPDFWGAYNVIEPEKSIESAIKKIKKSIDELNK